MYGNIDLTAAAVHYSLLYFSMIVLSGLSLAYGKNEKSKRKNIIFWASAILFVLMAFRDKGMGNDTASYTAMFNVLSDFANPLDYIRNSITEAGYLCYCWLLSRLVDNARILFFVSSAFIIGSLGRFANKYVDNVGLFYCLLVGTLYFDFLLSAVRQGMAIAILLFAFDYLIARKPVPYYALCILAVLFHNSSIVFLLLYPLFSAKNMAKKQSFVAHLTIFTVAFCSGFVFDSILIWLLRWFPKYSYYLGSVLFDGELRLAVILKFLVFLLLLVVPIVVRKKPSIEPLRDNAAKQMAKINLAIIVVASNATALMRFSSSFSPFSLMYYSNSVGRIRSPNRDKAWLTLFTLVAFYFYGLTLVVLKTPEWQTTYPIQLSWWIR